MTDHRDQGPALPLPRRVRVRALIPCLCEALGIFVLPFALVFAAGALLSCRASSPEGSGQDMTLPIAHGALRGGVEFLLDERELALAEGDATRARVVDVVREALERADAGVLQAIRDGEDPRSLGLMLGYARAGLTAVRQLLTELGDQRDDSVRYGLVGVRGALAFLTAYAEALGASAPDPGPGDPGAPALQ